MFSRVIAVMMYLLFLVPTAVVLASSFSERSIIAFPPEGFTFRWYDALLGDTALLDALWVSVVVGVGAAVVAAFLGTAAALALAWGNLRWRTSIEAFVLAPITLPNIVIGLSLLMVFSRLGLISLTGLIIGHVVIIVPFMVRTLLASLTTAERSLPRAAAVLGANPWQAFWYVTLPLIRPGIFAGSVFTFLVSFNNISISVWIDSPGAQPLPVVIFHRLELLVPDPTLLAVSGMIILGTILLMVLVDWRWSLFEALAR